MDQLPSYFKYLGKTRSQKEAAGKVQCHLLPYHSLDVAAVAWHYFRPETPLARDLADFLELTPQQLQKLITFFFALHDIGKFASAFQVMLNESINNTTDHPKVKRYNTDGFRHDNLGFYFWEQAKRSIFKDVLAAKMNSQHVELSYLLQSFDIIMEPALGHHGQPIAHHILLELEEYTIKEDLFASNQFICDWYDLMEPELPIEKMVEESWQEKLTQVSWSLAGAVVLCDWLGSNSDYVSFYAESMPLDTYWQIAQQQAEKLLKVTTLYYSPKVHPFQSFKSHFGFTPTPLQIWAESVEISNTPQLFILEDMTGSGKTEAALTLTHRLIEKGAANGFYFGLPTMATSNAMYDRVVKHYQQIFKSDEHYTPSIMLAHAARNMNPLFHQSIIPLNPEENAYSQKELSSSSYCNAWFTDSHKTALLTPVGVGTIDQTLLGVLPRRHQSLRLLGLHNKVLIFDEVHAADEYMFELLESLLRLHLHQGGSVILLTATLPQKQRQKLVNIWVKALGHSAIQLQEKAFPLVTYLSIAPKIAVQELPLSSSEDKERNIAISLLHSEQHCIEQILKAINTKQCVVWIRNSVKDALQAYRSLLKLLPNPEDCLLFHSRFIQHDRNQIEKQVITIFGKNSNQQQRQGKILIATQVFQESLDADSDVMISDICPIDDLIQRTGRLHRHTRNEQREYQKDVIDPRPAPVLYLYAPEWQDVPQTDWLSNQFKNTQFVYRSPGRLWLGLRILKNIGAIRLPKDARMLIESVYSDEAHSEIPESLLQEEHKYIGENRAKAATAASRKLALAQGYNTKSSSAWYEDIGDVSTRYNDVLSVTVLVLRITESDQLAPWVEEDKFSVSLSSVKMPKNQYADKLLQIEEEFSDAVISLYKKYRQAKNLQLWIPERDPNFDYCSIAGVYEQQH